MMTIWTDVSRTWDYNPRRIGENLVSLESSLGSLAYDDVVELAKLGETIVRGGYIRTELISAGIIRSLNHVEDGEGNVIKGSAIDLINGSIKTPNFSVIGETVTLRDQNRTAVITPEGLKSVFQYTSSGELSGWQRVGAWSVGGTVEQYSAFINVHIPSGITILSADLYASSIPKYFRGWDGVADGYYHARNLKLYHTDDMSGGEILWEPMTEYTANIRFDIMNDITSSVWGSTWTPTGKGVKTRAGSVKNYLEPGSRSAFKVQSTDNPTFENEKYSSAMQLELVVVAYVGGNV